MFSKNTYFEEKHLRAAASTAFEKYLESTEKKEEKNSRVETELLEKYKQSKNKLRLRCLKNISNNIHLFPMVKKWYLTKGTFST